MKQFYRSQESWPTLADSFGPGRWSRWEGVAEVAEFANAVDAEISMIARGRECPPGDRRMDRGKVRALLALHRDLIESR